MTCLHPIPCYQIKQEYRPIVQRLFGISPTSINCISFSGKWDDKYISPTYFGYNVEFIEKLEIPCRKCIQCRLDYSKRWALRCMLEFQSFDSIGCFITLTYDNEHLPSYDLADCSKDFQLFMKRFRKRFKGKKPVVDKLTGEIKYPIRYFHCGEYGTLNGRPHHHAIIFNFDFIFPKGSEFANRKKGKKRNGYDVFYSKELLKLWSKRIWTGEYEDIECKYFDKKSNTLRTKKYKRKVYEYEPLGKVEIGTVTFKSCSYVARYITKKVYGDEAELHYNGRKPDYITMSRAPGIGAYWFDEYYADIYKKDCYKFEGYRYKPPPFFDKLFEKIHPDVYEQIKDYRKAMAKELAERVEPSERFRELNAREYIVTESTTKLIRPLADEVITDLERQDYYNDSCFRFR